MAERTTSHTQLQEPLPAITAQVIRYRRSYCVDKASVAHHASIPMSNKMCNDRISEYISALMGSERLGEQVVYHRTLSQSDAACAPNRRPWPQAVRDLLSMQGIDDLYAHQALATDIVRAGRHVVVATPTASGKTLVYNLPVIERFLADPDARALYLFPLKALAQDQLKTFTRLTAHWPKEARPQAAIFDGDTTPHFRKKIRNTPPTVLMTNPEMLHLSILPHHEQWVEFLASLQYIVVDEVHTYRGVMGSHMAQVFRRLLRVCKQYGVTPTFIFCSATVGNPGELCRNLTGLDVEVVTESGAPQGNRHFVFMDPWDSPSNAAIMLLKSALARGLRTIVYTQSRKMTELISLWASEKSGHFKDKISAYRAGFLPEERREIEAKMGSGELLAVVSTSALELGIDIGALDLCILVGYPGTVMSTLQRGGRVGRAQQDSAVVLVAGEDALDQYFMRHPADFFERPPEQAVLNPYNPVVLKRHLECAAAELTLRPDEPWLTTPEAQQAIADLEFEGLLLRDADNTVILAARKRPHRHVDLRGAGHTFHIEAPDGTVIGSVDGVKAFRETHEGAVYLHKGQSWVISRLDIGTRTAHAVKGKVHYYTRVRANKNTEILEVLEQRVAWGTRVCLGRLRVTETITGYEKRNTRGGKLMGITPLDLPPVVFETEGLWFEIPLGVQQKVEDAYLHFMGAIHALEHAAIGILPLLVMTDRNDLGGISTPMHAQVGKPAVFIYDGMPGGAGLVRAAFDACEDMFSRTLAAIADCKCELGCPSCVHSPKCGSGNRPIDKAGAIFLLTALQERASLGASFGIGSAVASEHNTAGKTAHNAPLVNTPTAFEPFILSSVPEPLNESSNVFDIGGGSHKRQRNGSGSGSDMQPKETGAVSSEIPSGVASGLIVSDKLSGKSSGVSPHTALDGASGVALGATSETPQSNRKTAAESYCVFDVETQRSAEEVGGWQNAFKMRVSVAVLYDSRQDAFIRYTEGEIPQMVEYMRKFKKVIGFNSIRFDYKVLSPYATYNLSTLPTLDLLDDIRKRLSYRVSLDNLGAATFGTPKSADGLQALEWWKQGKIDLIGDYCEQDVRLTRDVYLYGKDNGYVLFTNKSGMKVRIPVDW